MLFLVIKPFSRTKFCDCGVPPVFDASKLSTFRSKLNNALSGLLKDQNLDPVRRVEFVNQRSIMFDHKKPTKRFLKITTQLPKLVASCRRVLEEGKIVISDYGSWAPQTFESNINFVLRFMNDRRITGCSWVTVPAGRYQLRTGKEKRTIAQIEIDANYADVV
jgi:DNA polymerase delta subunit 1